MLSTSPSNLDLRLSNKTLPIGFFLLICGAVRLEAIIARRVQNRHAVDGGVDLGGGAQGGGEGLHVGGNVPEVEGTDHDSVAAFVSKLALGLCTWINDTSTVLADEDYEFDVCLFP